MKIEALHIFPQYPQADLTVYLHEEIERVPPAPRRAMIVCPGGGYGFLSDREDEVVALAWLAEGFQAFSLHYGIGEHAQNYEPLIEACLAIRHVREHAKEYNVDPEHIFITGFSAGVWPPRPVSCGITLPSKPRLATPPRAWDVPTAFFPAIPSSRRESTRTEGLFLPWRGRIRRWRNRWPFHWRNLLTRAPLPHFCGTPRTTLPYQCKTLSYSPRHWQNITFRLNFTSTLTVRTGCPCATREPG